MNPAEPENSQQSERSTFSRDAREVYTKPRLTRHGKVTDMTLGGSPSVLDVESDGSIGRFNTPKN